MKGIDYAWVKPNPKWIVENGYQFVCRYLSNNPTKNLTFDELKRLHLQGLKVVVVWETGIHRPLAGYDAGVEDSTQANHQMIGLTGKTDTVIYFACDDDFTEQDQNVINDYFKGVISILGKQRVGVYGSYGVVKRCFDVGVVTYGWQTYAWSKGQWDNRAQLRQIHNLADYDIDESISDDFGQF
jgi:hypothetical protein